MKLGFSKQSILPPLPLPLSGFAKERVAHEVLDDVFVKVIALTLDSQHYVFVSYDLVGISNEVVKRLQAALQKVDVEVSQLIVSATHTHSSFSGTIQSDSGLLKGTQYIFGNYDESRVEHVVAISVDAIQEAFATMEEGSIRFASDCLEGVGSNRNDPHKLGDNRINIAYFTQNGGNCAVVYHFACHPTVLNHLNEKVSADFVGGVEALAQQSGYTFAMFLNGSCGDISTRFTRQASGYPELQRYAAKLFACIEKHAQDAKPIATLTMTFVEEEITLQRKQVEPLKQAQDNLKEWDEKVAAAIAANVNAQEIRVLESYREGAMLNVTHAKNASKEKQYRFPLTIMKANNHYFVFIPGELFSELSNALDNENVHFVTYTNDYLGYFADAAAYGERYYEAMSSPFAKGEAEHMMKRIQSMIESI